jgi:hypothetical protein
MSKHLIIPGLTVTDDMFEVARAAQAEHFPTVPALTIEQFLDATNWFLVPDPEGRGYKAEYQIIQTEDLTGKFNRWMAPDLRKGETPAPHSHPWEKFDAYVLHGGGYTDLHYAKVGDGVISTPKIHRRGAVNTILKDGFHEVVEVDPQTLTMMVCGKGVRGDWGYLDPVTGAYTHNKDQVDPHFKVNAKKLNPQLKR